MKSGTTYKDWDHRDMGMHMLLGWVQRVSVTTVAVHMEEGDACPTSEIELETRLSPMWVGPHAI